MEQEIDLRPYVQAVVRSWRLILGAVALAAVAAAIITVILPRAATARGDVLVVARTTQLVFDTRFVERDATMLTNAVNQRQALVDLASSPALEARVAAELGLGAYAPGELAGRIAVSARSDLLQIEAVGATPEEALRLAEAWASSYQSLVNEIYSIGDDAMLDEPLDRARQRYEQTQSDLVAFYATGDLVRAEQAVIRAEGVLSGTLEAHIQLYTDYLSRTQDLSLILEDARSLQAQYEGGGVADLGANIEALVVRARLAGAEQLPFILNVDGAAPGAQASRVDLAAFVRLLEVERDRRVAEATALAEALAAGDGAAVGMPPDRRARYETDLATARSILAQAQGAEERLLVERDLALSAFQVLQAKDNERQVDQAVPEISVRFVGATSQPPRSLLVRLVVNGVALVMVSLVLVLVFIIGREVLHRSASRRDAPTPPERPAERPVATD